MSELPAAGPLPAQRVATAERRPPYELVPSPDQLPQFGLVQVRGPDGEVLDAYRGVQRQDNQQIVSVVSSRYGLVQHQAVAEAVHAIAQALDQPQEGSADHPFPREQIRLYAQGRRMEVKLVIGREFGLGGEERFFPGIRVLNSLDGSWAVRCDAWTLRLACCNQLYAGMTGAIAELRELHLASSTDMLGQLERAIHEILSRFDGALDQYSRAMNEDMLAEDVEPALLARGIPQVHAGTIGARAEVEATHNGTLSRWSAYQVATAYLTREVQVNPDRERFFERAAAGALLLPSREGSLA